MIREIVFATNNEHKLEEMRAIIGDSIRILSLEDINCFEDIEETGKTLAENALIKARHVKKNYGFDCFADDTGLEVEALNGAPGVHTARYAGEDCNSEKNIDKILEELDGKDNRKACFVTVIALIMGKEENLFEGEVQGEILKERRGEGGFGYDAVFEPEKRGLSFAQMSADDKNAISHRGRATKKLVDYLKTI